MSWLLLTKYQYVGPPNYSLLIFYGTESFFSWQSFPFFPISSNLDLWFISGV